MRRPDLDALGREIARLATEHLGAAFFAAAESRAERGRGRARAARRQSDVLPPVPGVAADAAARRARRSPRESDAANGADHARAGRRSAAARARRRAGDADEARRTSRVSRGSRASVPTGALRRPFATPGAPARCARASRPVAARRPLARLDDRFLDARGLPPPSCAPITAARRRSSPDWIASAIARCSTRRCRRDFPILEERVHGASGWSGSTTPRPRRSRARSSIASRTSTSTRTRTSTAPRTRSRRAPPTPTRQRATRRARFLNAPSPKNIVFVRGATEGINLVAQSWGRRNVGAGDEIVITWLEHHANIVPWQLLAQRRAPSCASRRSTTAAR